MINIPYQHVSQIFPKDDEQPRTTQPLLQPISMEKTLFSRQFTDQDCATRDRAPSTTLSMQITSERPKALSSAIQQSEPNQIFNSAVTHNMVYGVVLLPWVFEFFGYIGGSMFILLGGSISIVIQIINLELLKATKQIRVCKLTAQVFQSTIMANGVQIIHIFNSLFYTVLILNFSAICTLSIIGLYVPKVINQANDFYVLNIGIGVFCGLILIFIEPTIKHINLTNLISVLSFCFAVISIGTFLEYTNVKDELKPYVSTIDSPALQAITSLTSIIVIFYGGFYKEITWSSEYQPELFYNHYVSYFGTITLIVAYLTIGNLSYHVFSMSIDQDYETIPFLIRNDLDIPTTVKLVAFLMIVLPSFYQLYLNLGITSRMAFKLVSKMTDKTIFPALIKIPLTLLIVFFAFITYDVKNIIVLLGSTSTCFLFIILPCLTYLRYQKVPGLLIYLVWIILIFGLTFSVTSVTCSVILIIRLINP